jgi:dTDP-4-dehydrorhamnose reductase
LTESGADGLHHLANRGDCTRLELAFEIQEILGTQRPLEGISAEEFGAAARRPRYSVLELDSTEALLGRELPHWRDALRRYLRR